MCVEPDNTRLVRLRHVGKDAVDHADQHAVLEWVTRILNDGNDVCAVCGHVDQISAATVGELNGEDCPSRTDNVRDVGNAGTGCGTEVEHFAARLHVDIFETAEDAGRKLGAERVPYAVFGFGCERSGVAVGGCVAGDGCGCVDADALLAVDRFAGRQILRHKEVLFAASDENTGMSVRFLESILSVQMFGRMVIVHCGIQSQLSVRPLRRNLHGRHAPLLVHHDHLFHRRVVLLDRLVRHLVHPYHHQTRLETVSHSLYRKYSRCKLIPLDPPRLPPRPPLSPPKPPREPPLKPPPPLSPPRPLGVNAMIVSLYVWCGVVLRLFHDT